MKIAKRLIAFFVLAVMLASSCLFVSADGTLSYKKGSTYTIESGVTYTNLTMTSGQNGNTVSGVAMEFNPKDGFIPMSFVAYSGSCSTLQTHYNVATSAKYSYDVAGLINGSFFTNGGLDYVNISNGRLTCAHVDQYNREVVAFDRDGNMKSVWSKLEFQLYANGTELPNALYAINKQYKNYKDKAPNAVYYYDTSCGTYTDTLEAGYEIVCQKINNTDIGVGKTLLGKVVEVKSNTYGTKFETNENIQSDKFVLYVKSASDYATTLKALKAGDDIAIKVNETNAAARSVMENALSTITNVGWLVKNGVDQTRTNSTIGSHSVTLQFRQTAFGQKPDGTYVFLTTEGASTGANGSLTLRDVADYFISQGCTNVIRMDGGGSSAMYVKNKAGTGSAGYTQSADRAVADTILVVKKSSIPDPLPEEDIETENQYGTNVALGKTYTTSAPYSSNGVVSYPDEDGKTMTDGENAQSDGKFNDPAFMGFNKSVADYVENGYSSITVDLGKKYDLEHFVAKVATSLNASAGIYAPTTVSVYVSDDNSTWKEAGTVNPVDSSLYSTVSAVISLDEAVCARYVQYRFVAKQNWIMVAEVEAYGVECDDADTDIDIKPGDVNASGKVDSLDYLLVKRACFKTYTLTDAEFVRAELSGDGKIDSADYLLVKRIAFGTYTAQ